MAIDPRTMPELQADFRQAQALRAEFEDLKRRDAERLQDSMRMLIERQVREDAPIENVLQSRASVFCAHLQERIRQFESGLDEQHEVGLRLVSWGDSEKFHLRDIGCSDPALVWLAGINDQGQPVELVEHVTQVRVCLVCLPRRQPDQPRRPIGFHGPPAE